MDFSSIFLSPEDGEATFANDESLPSMPVPSLKHTLDRFIDSVKPHMQNEEELREAVRMAREFEEGEGKELHARLLTRAKGQRNWVERWWLQGAYLSLREPLIPFYSMCGAMPLGDLGWKIGENLVIQRAAIYLFSVVNFWLFLRKEKLKPTRSANKTPFSMSQFRQLFNCTRIPGEVCDELVTYFKTEKDGECPSHIVVLSNGWLFRVETLSEFGVAIPLVEWERQLQAIAARSAGKKGPGIGLLTCDKRSVWAKNREHLSKICPENKRLLQEIESALFVAVLDRDCPTSETEAIYLSMNGDYRNRWADKSLCPVFFANGAFGGLCDHTAFDGAISVTTIYFVFLGLLNGYGKSAPTSLHGICRDFEELDFRIDTHIKSELQRAEQELGQKTALVALVHEKFSEYGKEFIQSCRLHPDSFAQMSLQLAYYRMHGKPAPTYETATTRAYYNGRTETLRSCTPEVVDWVKAMLSPDASVAEKKALLTRAIRRHDQLMTEAKGNAGCDRHLFGLYCLAMEEGLPVPSFYSHPAYLKSGGGGNFVLSTSLLGYTPIGGGVSPMCLDGYGCFYNIVANRLCFTISVYKASKETSATKFYDNLQKSLREMKAVLEQPAAKM